LTEKKNAGIFIKEMQSWVEHYPLENAYAMYNSLGSHDTERIYTLLNKNVEKLRLGFLILFSFPGAPAVYYGDETGMEGGPDPDNRRAFSWNEPDWNIELLQWVKRMIRLRNENNALRRGTFEVITVSNDNIFAFSRKDGTNQVIVIGNASGQSAKTLLDLSTHLPAGVHRLRNLLGNEVFEDLHGGILTIDLSRWSGMLLSPEE
jgi:glycosidase